LLRFTQETNEQLIFLLDNAIYTYIHRIPKGEKNRFSSVDVHLLLR
jgi:hypothetical protein